MIRKKRGWIRIVEAFIAILIISGISLVVIDKVYLKDDNLSSKIYDVEVSILREIELDSSMRKEILTLNKIPVELKFFDKVGLIDLKNKIIEKTPSYLDCNAKICGIGDICSLDEYLENEIFAQSVAITADSENYDPRQLKLFCWMKS